MAINIGQKLAGKNPIGLKTTQLIHSHTTARYQKNYLRLLSPHENKYPLRNKNSFLLLILKAGTSAFTVDLYNIYHFVRIALDEQQSNEVKYSYRVQVVNNSLHKLLYQNNLHKLSDTCSLLSQYKLDILPILGV